MNGSKERYYALDVIRCIGDQNRTKTQIQRDAKRVSRYLKEHKLGIYDPKVANRKKKQKVK
jgi:hypothetical protein